MAITTTHNGCKIKVRAGKGSANWGTMFATVNGESFPVVEKFDESNAVAEIARTLDYVHAEPVDGNRWPAYYYAPGTYVLCEHGHAVTPGETCQHTYCRKEAAAVESPDAAEQTPAADGPIVTPELRRAVVAAAHAESVSRDARERVDALRAADHLDQPAAAAEPAPSDPVAAIVALIEQYGEACLPTGGHDRPTPALADDLLDRIRRTLADALGTRRDREQYARIVAVCGRPVVCPCGYGVFDSCPVHD